MYHLKIGDAVVSFGYVVDVVAHKAQAFSHDVQLADYFYFSFVSHDFIPQIVL
jgi:hypothetical protein